MAYAPVVWQDHVTPVDQAHLNQMDNGIVGLDTGKVDKDSVVLAASRIVASKLASGHIYPAFQVNGDGSLNWGPGGGVPPDVNLYRSSANQLKTDDTLSSTAGLVSRPGDVAQVIVGNASGSAGIILGSAADTNLYRLAAGQLKTDGALVLGSDASTNTSGIRFGSTADTPFYRWGAGNLKAEANLYITANLYVNAGLPTQIATDTNGYLWFGSAYDTKLYRSAAGILKTDGEMNATGLRSSAWVMANNGSVANQIFLAADGKVYFGTAADTALYRSAAANLKTDGTFWAGASIVVDAVSAGNKIYFGGALDTNLYRSAAGVLQTDGAFHAVGGVSLLSGTDQVELHGELVRAGPNIKALKLLINGVAYKIDLKPA